MFVLFELDCEMTNMYSLENITRADVSIRSDKHSLCTQKLFQS